MAFERAEDRDIHRAALGRYFEMIDRRAPAAVARFVRWIRTPSMAVLRWGIAFLLVIGGIFSFLPVLGIWMLPLGLLLIAEDVPILQRPLVKSFVWTERKWYRVRAWWKSRKSNGRR